LYQAVQQGFLRPIVDAALSSAALLWLNIRLCMETLTDFQKDMRLGYLWGATGITTSALVLLKD
jgi:hypothetical protein